MSSCQNCKYLWPVWAAVDEGILDESIKLLRERADATSNPVYANGGQKMAIGSTDAYCERNEYLVTFNHCCSGFQGKDLY